MAKKTVVLSGIFFPLAILRYFEAALKRRPEINLITVGPYPSPGTLIPWTSPDPDVAARGPGMHLPVKYAIPSTIPLPLDRSFKPFIPISFIEAQLPQKPDLWLQIDAGFYLEGRPQNGKNVIVATDPHVLSYDRQRTFADTFYCMQDCYKAAGDVYLPYAYDPVWHAPEKQDRLFDVCLLGLHYPQRNALIDRLMQNGVKCYYDLGPVYDEARTIYNQAPVGINWSSKNDLTARVFELLGMRRLAVVNNVPDLPRFFRDGRDLVTFATLEEATEKILHYLANEDQLEAIASQGHGTVQPHTWDARINQILEDV
jgi:hypothetical protein